MSGPSSYDSVNQSYELADKKSPEVAIRAVDFNEDETPMLNQQPQAYPDTPHTTHWPAQPETLTEDPRWELLYDVYDSFLIAIAIVLLAKTSLCIYAYDLDKFSRGLKLDLVSPLTLNLIKFNEQVVTAFTIIFVTIMTTVTRRYALYKAQQGAYITDIEQLQASISLPSTIKMVFSLRKFTKFSVILVVLWSFYYMGSQASKREYAWTVSNATHPISAVYPADNMTTYFDFEPSEDYGSMYDSSPSSALVQYLKSARGTGSGDGAKLPTYGVDGAGNMLIPDPGLLYALYPNGTVNITDTFRIRPSETLYLTFAGRPLWVPKEYTYAGDNGTLESWPYWENLKVVGDYSLETSYIKFHCLSLDILPADHFPTGVLDTMYMSLNMTGYNSTRNATNDSPAQLQVWQRWDANSTTSYNYTSAEEIPAPRINGSDGGALRITCDILEPRVNIDVRCSETACLAHRMSCPYTDPSSLRATRFSNSTFASSFLNGLLTSEGTPKARNISTSVQWYLEYSWVIDTIANNAVNATNIQEVLDSQSSWLDTLINTYYNVAGRDYPPTDATEANTAHGFDPVKFVGAEWEPHYAIFWEWIAIDYLAGVLLLVAAIFSFWLRKRTLAPDIFGFVSSLTRDNPHFPVPPGGSTLGGMDRTRALRDVKVKIGDVSGPNGEVGRVGFIPISSTTPAGTLRKERKYM